VIALLRQSVTSATLLQLGADLACVFLAVVLAMRLHGHNTPSFDILAVPALAFSVLIVCLNGWLGLYRRDRRLPFAAQVGWIFFALLLGVPTAYLLALLLPNGEVFQEILGAALVIAFGGLVVVRHTVVAPLVGTLLPHRVLVLGTGPEARVVEASLNEADTPGLQVVGFYALEKVQESVVSPNRVLAKVGSIEDLVKRLGVREIIVAVRQQRGGVLPLRGLLECRLNGIQITDLARFFERVHGRVPIESLKASWLIYGNGFRQNWLRRVVKRAFDITVAATLLVLLLPLMAMVTLIISLERGGPVIFRQVRVGLRGEPFIVLKFRSMRADAEGDGTPRWAAHKDPRVTPLGRILRRSRIDELPQLLNVLKGEMSFVGPRPERPAFVEMLTEQVPFYAVRHSVKPGITGWAQVRYPYGASVDDAIEKLQYDLYYVKNHCLFLDLMILIDTVQVVLWSKGAR
jgi:sugar transferase (PEP-CTERM system associated)